MRVERVEVSTEAERDSVCMRRREPWPLKSWLTIIIDNCNGSSSPVPKKCDSTRFSRELKQNILIWFKLIITNDGVEVSLGIVSIAVEGKDCSSINKIFIGWKKKREGQSE